MWKWTKIDKVKLIFLDKESLDDCYLHFPYQDYMTHVEINMITAKDIEEQKGLRYLAEDLIASTECESYESIALSSDLSFLKDMMAMHIGTIFVGKMKAGYLKYMPDYVIDSIDLLPDILTGKNKGYLGEVIACQEEGGSLLSCSAHIFLNGGLQKETQFYFGGRYYPEKHHYLLDDPLSTLILHFKHEYVYRMDLFFQQAIQYIQQKEVIDCITYIPPKPQDIKKKRFQRFLSLEHLKLENILVCQKDFSQKSYDFIGRKETVKDVFLVDQDVKEKNILLIDDVYSTGATIKEAIKMLYEAGANRVVALAIAVSQLTESSLSYKKLSCPCCNEPMELIYHRKTKRLFFGCTHYLSHLDQNTIMNLQVGLSYLKELNRIEYCTLEDLFDVDDDVPFKG